VHGIRGQEGQDAQEKEPSMAAKEWPNVLQEPGNGGPRDGEVNGFLDNDSDM
jgi:hypothetical protein